MTRNGNSLSGTMRALSPHVDTELKTRLRTLCDAYAQMSGCSVELTFAHACPPCVNAPEQSALAVEVLSELLGKDNVSTQAGPFPFSDDFSLMLEQWPGAYIFLGMDSAMCHNPAYQFDDALLPLAAATFSKIVERRLG